MFHCVFVLRQIRAHAPVTHARITHLVRAASTTVFTHTHTHTHTYTHTHTHLSVHTHAPLRTLHSFARALLAPGRCNVSDFSGLTVKRWAVHGAPSAASTVRSNARRRSRRGGASGERVVPRRAWRPRAPGQRCRSLGAKSTSTTSHYHVPRHWSLPRACDEGARVCA
jgi:hypothetical protein